MSDLGTRNDRICWEKQARFDSIHQQQDIEMAHGWIFTRGYLVNGTQVDRTMSKQSLTPNWVCDFHF